MINRATLLGRIGNKEVKKTKNGNEMASISIATNRKYLDAKGHQKEITTWHTVYFYNKLAGVVEKYTDTGDLVYIEGEINNKKLEDENGSRWMYSVTGSEIKLLPNLRRGNGNNHNQAASAPQDDGYFSDDIPF